MSVSQIVTSFLTALAASVFSEEVSVGIVSAILSGLP